MDSTVLVPSLSFVLHELYLCCGPLLTLNLGGLWLSTSFAVYLCLYLALCMPCMIYSVNVRDLPNFADRDLYRLDIFILLQSGSALTNA